MGKNAPHHIPDLEKGSGGGMSGQWEKGTGRAQIPAPLGRGSGNWA